MRNNKKTWVPVLLILGASVLISWFLVAVGTDVFGLNETSEVVEIELTSTDMKTIATTLKGNGIIKNAWFFPFYEKLYRKAGKVKNQVFLGTFTFNKGLAYNDIIRTITQNPRPVVTIDFPNGSTVRDIAKKLEKENVCTQKDFFTTLEKSHFSFWFLDQIPENKLRFNKYEGYFFPDKYEFYINENPLTIINRFFNNFDKKASETLKQSDSKLTPDEIIILASIVEAEAGSGPGTNGVASVFLNRLANTTEFRRLESDVTKIYIKNNIEPYINSANQELLDAYNTYKCTGLPAGPIGNPSLFSMKAVANPKPSDYFFFVTDDERQIYWGKTLEEHSANKRKAAEQNAKLKQNPAKGEKIQH